MSENQHAKFNEFLTGQRFDFAGKKADQAEDPFEKWVRKDGRDSRESSVWSEGFRTVQALNVGAPEDHDLKDLPDGSFFICVPFTLEKPYISKDHDQYYPIDNPARKDFAFKCPCISAASWKGSLHLSFLRAYAKSARRSRDSGLQASDLASLRLQMTRLFGSEKGDDGDESVEIAGLLRSIGSAESDERFVSILSRACDSPPGKQPHIQGGLRFFCSDFDSLDMTMINPLDRETRTSNSPIRMECIPGWSAGHFSMLFIPRICHMKMGASASDIADCLNHAVTVLTEYGIGAKRLSGYGRASIGGAGKPVFLAYRHERKTQNNSFPVSDETWLKSALKWIEGLRKA